MPEQTKASINGPISPAEAAALRDSNIETGQKEAFLKVIGATAGKESVALVVAPDSKTGELQGDHFVSLRHDDLGTVLEPEHARDGAPAKELGLPSPAEAHDMLKAQNPDAPGNTH